MTQVKLSPQAFFPMPMALVGTQVDGRVNFMPEAWICRANYEPPLLAVAMNRGHYSHEGIMANGAFSVCFPGRELLQRTDYCGLVSGREVDKSAIFEVFYGQLPTVPLIRECRLNLACRLVDRLEFATNSLFVAEIMECFADGDYLDGTRPDHKAMELFFLTLPDNSYWSMGERIGEAWHDGRGFSFEGIPSKA